jgi:hypothetical protein
MHLDRQNDEVVVRSFRNYVVSPAADKVDCYRIDANRWNPSLPPAEASRRAGHPAGFEMHRSGVEDARSGYSSGKPAQRRPTTHVFSRSAQNGRCESASDRTPPPIPHKRLI